MGRIIPYMKWKNKIHVPNHQPDMDCSTTQRSSFSVLPKDECSSEPTELVSSELVKLPKLGSDTTTTSKDRETPELYQHVPRVRKGRCSSIPQRKSKHHGHMISESLWKWIDDHHPICVHNEPLTMVTGGIRRTNHPPNLIVFDSQLGSSWYHPTSSMDVTQYQQTTSLQTPNRYGISVYPGFWISDQSAEGKR